MSFQTKIIGLFVTLILIVELVSSYFIYTTATKLIEDATSRDMMQVVNAAKRVVNPEMFGRVVNKTLAMKHPERDRVNVMAMWEYREIRTKLAEIKTAFQVKYLYTMARNSLGQKIYIIDGYPFTGEQTNVSLPGQVENEAYKNLDDAFNTKQPQLLHISSDKRWGENFSIYYPIQNLRGELLGIIGVDVEASPLLDLANKTKQLIIIIVSSVTVIMVLIAWVLTRVLMKPFDNLTQVAKAVSDGDLSIRSGISSNDEIGQLSNAFDTMLSVVQENQLGMDRMFANLSRIRRRDDLERQVIAEVQRILRLEEVVLLLWSKQGFQLCQSISPTMDDFDFNALIGFKPEFTLGEIIACEHGYMVPIGQKRSDAYALFVHARESELRQRDRLAMKMLARYTAIYFENMDLVEELNLQIQELKLGEQLPVWMNKLFLQISENERKRLASDLHDEVLQEIVKLRRLSVASVQQSQLSAETKISLERLDIGLINLNDMIRETCNRLMPSFLMERGIVEAIRELVEKTRLRADFELQFEVIGSFQQLSDEETLSIYRIIQEWISNAVTHAHASQVELMMRQAQQVVTLYYSDNGVGFDLQQEIDRSHHLGMFGVQERIRMLGGQMTIRSARGEGVEMSCQFPLQRNKPNG